MKSGTIIVAALIGCFIVVWVGTVAAANLDFSEHPDPQLSTAHDGFSQVAETHVHPETLVKSIDSLELAESYPPRVRQWYPLIEKSAQETGLPASLIAAVIFQESSGDPLAYSSSGAVGLMQVMPRDGLAAQFICANGPCFSDRPSIQALQDPAFNVYYGSQMLADLYKRHGSYREALFRYGPINMGYDYADLVLGIWENNP